MPMTKPDSNNLECPIFHDMTPDECRNVLELFETETFPMGETILREGLSIQILWIIVRGRCEVVKSTAGGGDRVLACLEQGSVFGEMSFFRSAPHSASVRAMTDVEVLRLSRQSYDQLQKNCPSAAFKIASNTAVVLAERLRRMDEFTGDMIDGGSGNANQREEWQQFRAKLYTEWEF